MINFARNYEIHAALEEFLQFLEQCRTTVVSLRCVHHHDHFLCKLLCKYITVQQCAEHVGVLPIYRCYSF